jgi:hypothetical protein
MALIQMEAVVPTNTSTSQLVPAKLPSPLDVKILVASIKSTDSTSSILFAEHTTNVAMVSTLVCLAVPPNTSTYNSEVARTLSQLDARILDVTTLPMDST